jgi:hypothetical protein
MYGVSLKILNALIGATVRISAEERHAFLKEALVAARSISSDEERAKVLIALKPHLPEGEQYTVLEEALTAALAIDDERSRSEELEALAPHLPRSLINKALTASYAIIGSKKHIDVLITLIRLLPEEEQLAALVEVLTTTRAISDEWRRAEALAALIPHLPMEERPAVIEDALTAARAISDEWSRNRLLAALAPQLPMVRITEALDVVRTISFERDRTDALIALAPQLPTALIPEALDVVRTISFEWNRADALIALAPQLPETLFPEFLAVVRSIHSHEKRAAVLIASMPQLPGREQFAVLEEALTAARAIGVGREWSRSEELAALAPHLPRSLINKALTAAYAIIGSKERIDALVALIQPLPEEEQPAFLDEVLGTTRVISDDWSRAEALIALMPHLPIEKRPEVIEEALTAARAISFEWSRANTLIALIPHLSIEERPAVVEEAFTAARTISGKWSSAEALIALAPQLPEHLIPEALEVARAISDEWSCAKALIALAPQLPEHLIPEALEVARAISDEWSCAKALIALAPQLPEHLIPEALDAVRAISDERSRATALIALAPQLPEPLIPEALAAARAIGDEWSYGMLLTALAPQLTPEEQSVIFTDILTLSNWQKISKVSIALVLRLPPEERFIFVQDFWDAMDKLLNPFGVRFEHACCKFIEREDISLPHVVDVVPTSERHISIWIDGRAEKTSEPLRKDIFYTLNFKVGAPVVSSLVHGPETEVPSADVPPGGLLTQWVIISNTVELTSGTMDTSAVATENGASKKWTARFSLLIPEQGESAAPQLHIKLNTLQNPHLDVVIFANNELYRTFIIDLVAKNAEATHADEISVIRDEVVHGRSAQLGIKPIPEWATPPRVLSVVVRGSDAYVHGDAGPGPVDKSMQWNCAPALVTGKIEQVRSSAERFRARWEDYLDDIDPDDLALRFACWTPEFDWSKINDLSDSKHHIYWDKVSTSHELRDFAFDGRRLYDVFFPAGTELRACLDSLTVGQRLNISWLSMGDPGWLPHVPWGLMYLLDIPVPGGAIDPMGFLAFRFRLSYTAYPVQAPSKALGGLDESYGSHFLYWGDDPKDIAGVEARWQRRQWSTLRNQVFVPAAHNAEAKAELLKLLDEPASPASVMYLFCKCDVGRGKVTLRFGNSLQPTDVVSHTELSMRPLENRPLIFANACTTAAGDPCIANELEDIAFARGCRAYLGTETKVPIHLASRFASVFFHFFYRRANPAPMAAGEAVVQTRLFLWTHYRNIGGLFYTYVNLYDLFLASDAELNASKTQSENDPCNKIQ